MINANELRIGNWVVLPIGRVIQVESIYITGINISSGYEGGIESDWSFDVINPIQLTPEILEKCGFGIFRGYYSLGHEKFNLASIDFDAKNNCVYLDFEGTMTGIEIKSLHQLQNLYFALIGEELEVRL